MLLWDWEPALGLSEEEQIDEIQVSSINVTTRIKAPIMDQSLVLPKTMKIKENTKKIISTTQTQPKFNPKKIKETNTVVNKSMKTLTKK